MVLYNDVIERIIVEMTGRNQEGQGVRDITNDNHMKPLTEADACRTIRSFRDNQT